MADIRLKKITVETNQSPLIIHNGDVSMYSTTVSFSAVTGSLITNGGIGVNCTADSSSPTAGGSLTIGGGIGIAKSLQVGQNITQDTSTGIFRIRGLSADRFFVDSATNKQIVCRPDGVNDVLIIRDNVIEIKATDSSMSSTHGALVVMGGVSISSTSQSLSGTQGGALTVAGGGSFGGKLNINGGLCSVAPNTIGNLFTTGGNIGINTSSPSYQLDIQGDLRVTQAITSASLHVTSPTGLQVGSNTIGTFTTNAQLGITSGQFLVTADPTIAGLVMKNTSYSTLLKTTNNTFEVLSGSQGSMMSLVFVSSSGNIGVQNTSPAYAFDVATGTINTQMYTGGNVEVGNRIKALDIQASQSMTTGTLVSQSVTSGSLFVGISTIGTLAVLTSATIPTVIGSNYNVTNISTTNLVASSIATLNISTTNLTSASIIANTISSGSIVADFVSSGSISVSGTSALINDANTVGSIFTTGGNVGIQQTAPSRTLDIGGSLQASRLVLFSSTQGSTSSSVGALVLLDGGLSINNTANATNVTRGGSATFAGGASIAKNVYVGGELFIMNTTPSTSYNDAAVHIAGGLSISGNQNAANIGNGGALSIAGGASVGGDLWVGGEINGSGSSSSTFAYITLTATDQAINYTTGSMVTLGGVTIQANANATSVTNGGALLVNGGASFNGDVYIGFNNYVYGSTNYYAPTPDVIVFYDNLNTKSFSIDFDIGSNAFGVSRYDDNGLFVDMFVQMARADGKTTFTSTTPSTSSVSAAVVVTGGLSIGSTAPATSLSDGGGLTISGGQSISENLLVGKTVTIFSTTESTNVSSGSLLVHGGVGISGNLNVLGTTTINGDLTVRGTTTSVESSNTVITDNVLVLNSGPLGTKDSGFVIQRFQGDNDLGQGDVVNDNIKQIDTIPLQTGVNANQVKMSASASSVDDYYEGWWVKVGSGFSTNQVRKIISYTGATRLAVLSSNWTTQNPAIGDQIYLYNKPIVGLIFNEINDIFEFGASTTDPSNTVNISESLGVRMSSLTCISTQPSTNSSTGALLSSGGLSISNTQNATSATNGGSITALGGGGFGKDVYVGGRLYVNGVDTTPNINDILALQTFSANNNQSTFAPIISISNSVWGFDIFLTAKCIAATNQTANYHIRGVNKDTSWELATTYVGDDMGIQFDMTNAGEVRYTSPNFASFVSLTFKYKCFTN